MSSVRRHLASLGLAVALCHLVIQVLVPAALCCERKSVETRPAVSECCPAGSHPPGLCPMHASSKAKSRDKRDCQARPLVDLHDLFVALNTGGVLPAPAVIAAPVGIESAPFVAHLRTIDLSTAPPGPPPRA